MIFRIIQTDAHPLIQCSRCLEEVRAWDDKQIAKWKQAHSLNCARNVNRPNQEMT